MNFKNIALVVLLLPVASYSKSTETRIKELETFEYQAELKLSDLGEKIAKKNEFINELNSQYHAKIKDEKKETIDSFKDKFLSAITKEKNINNILITELIDEWGHCDSVKFVLLRMIIEKGILKSLIKQYEECIQSLINNGIELERLKQ